MPSVLLKAYAKINYALDVRGRREDGYHEIATVFQSVSLADEVEISRAERGFELLVEPAGAGVGPTENNTVYAAWNLLRESTGRDLPVSIRLHKKIPHGAGLGGGSADGAAALIGLNALFDLALSPETLHGLGLRIGADVPFCFTGGTALGEGVGEVLSPLPAPPAHHLVLVKPVRGADTGEVYRGYDASPRRGKGAAEPVLAALRAGDLGSLARTVGNDLAPITKKLAPEVAAHERQLLEAGALGAAMTGTGTAVYGIFGSEGDARVAVERLDAPFAGVFEPISRGVERLLK
jgi:4-diphosphocytidyl-2-C-methyl-D-erythritol kinase